MSEAPPDLRTLLKARFAAERERLDRHPSHEELEALWAGSLSPDEERRLRAHLTLCPECGDIFLALSELRNLDASPSEETSHDETRAAWARLHPKLGSGEIRPVAVASPARPSPGWWLAAALALAVVGLSSWSLLLYQENQRLDARLRQGGTAASTLSARLEQERRRAAGLAAQEAEKSRQIAELRRELGEALRPRINTPVLDLAPRSHRGASSERAIPEIPKETEIFTLILEPEDRREFRVYTAEILDPSGRVLWSLNRLTKTEYGNFTLTLAREALPSGVIRIRLVGEKARHKELIGEYALQMPPN